MHSDYTLVDDKLYRHFNREVNDEDTTSWKLCVPKYQRQRILKETHDEITGGHLGVRKTLNKVASRYFWPGLARDVSSYVRRCEICQRYKISQQKPAGKMLTRIPEEPWSRLCADFVGPLPRTSHGNTMLLVLFDNFSKWVELIPCRKATAENVVKAIRERIVSRYGVPKSLITDNGTQFTSRVLKRYLEESGIKQQFTAPYTPQENPTERANRTIKTIIAQFSGERHNRWDELLPEVMLALNTSTSESTGYSPAFLTQGRNPRLPKALYDDVTVGSGARCVNPEERAEELKDIFKIVRNNLEKASQKQRHHYNLRRRNWTPTIGDHVLVRQHPLSRAVDNFTAKLAPKFKGPYVVIDFTSPVIVRVRAIGNREELTAHISELKPYQHNNPSFSLLSSRSLKLTERKGDIMESNRRKFERTREKFRRNIQKENEKIRRTVFLEDDEVPCSSKGHLPKNRRSTSRPAPSQARRGVQPERVQKEKCFRMTVTTPPRPDKVPHKHTKPETVTPNQVQTNCDYVFSSDDETPPPPPKWEEQCPASPVAPSQNEPDGDKTPLPSIWADESFETDDLEVNSEDLNDPVLLEFCRSVWGMSDTTIDRRPPTPPSPLESSFSSLDWENEDFRPPTPPKRRGFVNIEVQDRNYPYLGMQCYERVVRAQILVPKTKTMSAITNHAHQQLEETELQRAGSLLPKSDCLNREIPVTPGRGWLNSQVYACQETRRNDRASMPPCRDIANSSPIPPSPPILNPYCERGNTTPIPSPPPVSVPYQTPECNTSGMKPIPTMPIPEYPRLEQLPDDILEAINEVREARKGTRVRFRQEIWGITHRVTITRNGEVQIARI